LAAEFSHFLTLAVGIFWGGENRYLQFLFLANFHFSNA